MVALALQWQRWIYPIHLLLQIPCWVHWGLLRYSDVSFHREVLQPLLAMPHKDAQYMVIPTQLSTSHRGLDWGSQDRNMEVAKQASRNSSGFSSKGRANDPWCHLCSQESMVNSKESKPWCNHVFPQQGKGGYGDQNTRCCTCPQCRHSVHLPITTTEHRSNVNFYITMARHILDDFTQISRAKYSLLRKQKHAINFTQNSQHISLIYFSFFTS